MVEKTPCTARLYCLWWKDTLYCTFTLVHGGKTPCTARLNWWWRHPARAYCRWWRYPARLYCWRWKDTRHCMFIMQYSGETPCTVRLFCCWYRDTLHVHTAKYWWWWRGTLHIIYGWWWCYSYFVMLKITSKCRNAEKMLVHHWHFVGSHSDASVRHRHSDIRASPVPLVTC